MHPKVYAHFEGIIAQRRPDGPVVEIGSVPSGESLLALPDLSHLDRLGVNLDIEGDYQGIKVIKANGNDLQQLATSSVGCVLSNATLEHDQRFWLTLAEIRRILRPGGLAVLGVPGFTVESHARALELDGRISDPDWLTCSALTFAYHAAPDDYYRFSESAVREIFFEGFADVSIQSIMMPPRTIGHGLLEK